MKPIIVDLKDISDSTEVYDSKPNKFISYTIYIICAILIIALLWMYFFRMDIVVKADSVFRGDDDSVLHFVLDKINWWISKINKVYSGITGLYK